MRPTTSVAAAALLLCASALTPPPLAVGARRAPASERAGPTTRRTLIAALLTAAASRSAGAARAAGPYACDISDAVVYGSNQGGTYYWNATTSPSGSAAVPLRAALDDAGAALVPDAFNVFVANDLREYQRKPLMATTALPLFYDLRLTDDAERVLLFANYQDLEEIWRRSVCPLQTLCPPCEPLTLPLVDALAGAVGAPTVIVPRSPAELSGAPARTTPLL